MMNKSVTVLAALLFAFAAGSASFGAAASGGDMRLEPAPINRLDMPSLQRGARTFVNYCLNCHSAKYMRYNRLTDIGVDEAMIRDNLMFATDRIGDTMTVAMPAQDAKGWFGTPPPDLSVIARVRGADWLYNYFLGFYRDDAAPSGWNNLVFPNVAMPHVLWTYSGTNRLVSNEYEDHEKAQAAAIALKGLSVMAPAKDQICRRDGGDGHPGHAVALRIQDDGRRPRQLPRLHERAREESADQPGAHRAPVFRPAVRLCVLAQARILEGCPLAAIVNLQRG
jgi:ubiquinol-cytochrome c reductase cytochrome c1 subunit